MIRSEIKQETITMIDILTDEDLLFANQFIKKLILAWDPDFTKLTPKEAEELERIQSKNEYVNAEDVDWGF